MSAPKPPYQLEDLLNIMARLRDPQRGCPWDLKQCFQSIAPYTIEEAYEVADAIERGALDELKDELGDLLFQVVYHAQLAREAQAFSFADVIESVSAKMVRRHPHVFGDDDLQTDEEISRMWEDVKSQERRPLNGEPDAGLLSSVTQGLPGLTRAYKLQKKAATVGFDWQSHEPILEKLSEELEELKEALEDTSPEAADKQCEEFGDLLFVMANIARHLKIDPEAALRGANQKFVRRFGHIEQSLQQAGRTLKEASLDEMEALWDQAKCLEKGKGKSDQDA